MKQIFEKLRDRYNILILGLSLSLLVLAFRLASLTIVQGEELRKQADTRKFKEIPITAPRGEIRDRYGRLLAGNNPSFTIQVVKDELESSKDKKQRNKTLIELAHILEDEGVNYNDEFPIKMNSFAYTDESMYFENPNTPSEEVVSTIVNNNLVGELIGLTTEYSNQQNANKFSVGNKVVGILQSEGVEMPIKVNVDQNGNPIFEYDSEKDIDKWKENNGISKGMDARSAVLNIINNRNVNKIVTKIVSDPVSSKLAYDMLKSKGLIANIKLVPFSFTFDEEYEKVKRGLMQKFSGITIKSAAIDDFISILKETDSFTKMLESTHSIPSKTKKDKKETIVPGQVIIELLEEKYKKNKDKTKIPIKVEINEKTNKVTYKFTNNKDRDELYKKYNIKEKLNPQKTLMFILEKEKEVKNFIKREDISRIAQEIIIKQDIYPKIGISTWKYSALNDKEFWLKRYKISAKSDAEKAFKEIRKKTELPENLSDYEARIALLILDQVKNMGHRGYHPVNIAYGIKDTTIAKIEENKGDMPGVKVSLEPVRQYPMGSTAAHILGYLGSISSANELEKYTKAKGYLPNYFIGKSGVEATFEEYLKGKDGKKRVQVDAVGNVVDTISEEKAKPGSTLYLTIDAELQKITENALEQALTEIRRGGTFKSKWGNYSYGKAFPYATSGAAVAIDVKTGEILALANYPSYDPNLFATGISSEDWKMLNPDNGEDKLGPLPMYNMAIGTAVQPGSIFKMITGIAAQENGIPASKKIYDGGYVKIGNRNFGCWLWNQNKGSHGWEDLKGALKDSCNYYFFSAALGRDPRTGEKFPGKAGIDEIAKVAKEFGLDEKTGIEINGEMVAGVPKTKTKSTINKRNLTHFLEANIESYIKEGVELSKKDIKKIIDEIVSWTELEKPLSKRDIINKLSEMGIDGEKKLEGNKEDISDTIKYTYLNQSKWGQGDTLNISIGQGQNAYTPIQMANYIATIANGGNRHKVSVVDKIESYDNTKKVFEPKKETHKVDVKDPKYILEVAKGMSLVTGHDGTAGSPFKNFKVKVAAKTGTAQVDRINPKTGKKYDNYAWFSAFAPYEPDNPDAAQIAVVVFLSQGGKGGYGAPVAREIIAQYLGLNEDEKSNELDLNNKLAR
ncbi:penicillin-binding protein 2 [Gottschalkia purinilytica]|uniref:Penicillin-binding protein 2 n=1 Tax=Gottschalkia purinilytica TaxID=1503 RepID=A0A0L0WDC1_GOTPU|nr:penicillin-binding transpeptidase domain-containing protein [Gottschalkia purinilytica]KNF09458.1 penicillin-binding protein 2 [Gottschalkia purinilytica]